jgi:hypothetical protein
MIRATQNAIKVSLESANDILSIHMLLVSRMPAVVELKPHNIAQFDLQTFGTDHTIFVALNF